MIKAARPIVRNAPKRIEKLLGPSWSRISALTGIEKRQLRTRG